MTQMFETMLGRRIPENTDLKIIVYIREDPSRFIPMLSRLKDYGYDPLNEAYIHRFYIPPNYRGGKSAEYPNLSRDLHDAIEFQCREAGATRVWAVLKPDNKKDLNAVIRFYRKRGYSIGEFDSGQFGKLPVAYKDLNIGI